MDKNIVALVREDTKTVAVEFFQSNTTTGRSPKSYTYVTTLDLVVGDLVVVLVGGERPTVAVVVRVDETPQIEPNSDITYYWISAKVDMSYCDKLTAANKAIQDVLTTAYVNNSRQQFRNVLLQSVDADAQAKLAVLMAPQKG